MKNKTNKILILVFGAIILVGITAGAAAYITKESVKDNPVSTVSTNQGKPRVYHQQPQQQVQQPVNCNDHNIVGTVAGAALGGLAGSQVGKGDGKTAATVGGALGGAYLGNQYIATNGVACK